VVHAHVQLVARQHRGQPVAGLPAAGPCSRAQVGGGEMTKPQAPAGCRWAGRLRRT
jgi:hypothetical protein